MNRLRHPLAVSAVLGLTMAFTSPITLAQKVDVRGVTRGTFAGWSDVLLMESKNTPVRAVLAPSVGARILAYGFGKENILWTNPNAAGSQYRPGEAPFDPGGFVCAIGPEVVSQPPHPLTLLGPYSWSTKKKAYVVLKGPEDPGVGVEMEKEVAYDPASGDLGFVHRIKNISDRDAAFCLWHRIACQPGGFALFPINKKSRFSSGWAIRQDIGGKIHYEDTRPESPAVRVLDGILVARTGGTLTKIGADSAAQWLAYAHGRTLFVIHFPFYSSAVYSDAGHSVTVAWDETKTELQPLSPEARLRSRKSYEFPIKWSLIALPAEVTSHEAARALADQIPGSPFL